jgi:sortase A
LSASQSGLTLVSSGSSGWRSGWAPSHTVYVDAILMRGSVQPAPAGAPTSVGTAALPMQGDPKVLVPLIFWLEGLVVAVAALIWTRMHWGRWQTWIIGVPVVGILLWGASGAVMEFLPNLL